MATLGSSLALGRESWTGRAVAGPAVDIGVYEMASFHVYQVDAEGRIDRVSRFGAERLGDAVAALYERYAELLSDGPARDRAAAAARPIEAVSAPLDPDRWAAVISPTVEWTGQGPTAVPPGRGAENVVANIRHYLAVGEVTRKGTDDVLALRPDA